MKLEFLSHFQLRLLYECNPMAFIIEQAGGLASDGNRPLLDIVPESIHDRAPIYIGSKDDVNDYLACKPWRATLHQPSVQSYVLRDATNILMMEFNTHDTVNQRYRIYTTVQGLHIMINLTWIILHLFEVVIFFQFSPLTFISFYFIGFGSWRVNQRFRNFTGWYSISIVKTPDTEGLLVFLLCRLVAVSLIMDLLRAVQKSVIVSRRHVANLPH